jgi:hypothetical protein
MTNEGNDVLTNITDYPSVTEKTVHLGCVYPESGVTLLPLNFASATSISELRHASLTSTIRKLLLQGGIPLCDIVERSQRPPYVKNKSSTLILPILYFSASFLSDNPTLVTVALNVVSTYIYESLRHIGIGKTVRFQVVVEKKKNEVYKQITYEGSGDGLKELIDVIREAVK